MNFVSRYLDPALIERLNHLQLSARRVVEGTINGGHRSPVKGASVEFRQHRFYTPGDEPRRLDWRVLARTDRPYIKEYDEETNLRCVALLDCSGSMSYGAGAAGPDDTPRNKFEYAARFIASIAYLMLRHTESVGLALAGQKLEHWLPAHAGTAQLAKLIDVLERAVARGKSDPGKSIQEAADRLERRSLVIVVSDFFTPVTKLMPGLARLNHDRHEAIVLRVLHPDEVKFPFEKWSRFRGMEGETPQLCEPALVRKTYLDNFRRHAAQLQETCRATGAEFYSYTTDQPLIESVTTFLRRRAARA